MYYVPHVGSSSGCIHPQQCASNNHVSLPQVALVILLRIHVHTIVEGKDIHCNIANTISFPHYTSNNMYV